MATYYIRKTGNNGNAGTSAGAAWADFTNVFSVGSGVTGGDTLYVGAGVYRNSGLTCSQTSYTSEVIIAGDYNGAQTGDAGEVIVTPYDTNDTTLPAHTNPTLNLNGRDYMTFRRLTFVGGRSTSATCILATTTLSTNIKFQDCTFQPGIGGNTISVATTAGNALSWLIERCDFLCKSGSIILVSVPQHTSEYDVDFVVRNCILQGGDEGIFWNHSGSSTNLGTGLIVRNCFVSTWSRCLRIYTGTATTITTACKVENNIIVGAVTAGLAAGHTSQVAAQYNLFYCNTPRVNVSAGTGDVTDGSRALLVERFESIRQGRTVYPDLMPMSSSGVTGYGNATGAPADDFFGQSRPGVGTNAVGPMERNSLVTTSSSGGYIF